MAAHAAGPGASMSPQGRPKGEYRSAQHEGTPVSELVRWVEQQTSPELTDDPIALRESAKAAAPTPK